VVSRVETEPSYLRVLHGLLSLPL